MGELKSRITSHIEKTGRVMITDGGAHPPEFWAQVTAEHIAPIGPDVTGKRLRAARAVQDKIADALEPHHKKVQAEAKAIDPESYLDAAVADVVKAAEGSEWEDHFKNPEVQAMIRQEVGRHFATAQHIAIQYAKGSN